MQHLAKRGIACPTPIAARSSRLFGTLKDRDAAIMTFLDGVSLRRPTPDHCYGAGRALAATHQAGHDFPLRRANALSVEGWRRLAGEPFRDETENFSDLLPLVRAELEFLTAAWPDGLPQGVIHADLFPDNVLFLSNRVSGLIDFYFACNDALAYDLAVMINAWCFDIHNRLDTESSAALLAGYQDLRPLAPSERQTLPLLARGAALRFTLTRVHDWLHQTPGAIVLPKNPREFAARLKFHQGVRGAEVYGL
jgi:homoserine kinase type II